MKKIFCVLCTLSMMLSYNFVYAAQANIVEYYVSADGNDANNGSIDSPFKTLEKARDTVRGISKENTNINIYIRGGEYRFNSSFELSAADSGSDTCSIVYSAYNNEKVIFRGDVDLGINDYISENGNIRTYDLKKYGISDFGNIPKIGKSNVSELFADDKAQTIARWPNYDYAKVKAAVQSSPIIFTADERCKNWVENDAYAVGMWQYNWAVEGLKIESVAGSNVSLQSGNVYPVTYGARYYAHNILSELDCPGEYYIDRTDGILYYYPVEGVSSITLSVLSEPIIKGNLLKNVSFYGIEFKNTRDAAIDIDGYTGGAVKNCTVHNTADSGIVIKNASGASVVNCELYDTGKVAVRLAGGDTADLTAGNNRIENCRIYCSPRLEDVGFGGIYMSGVGNTIKGCEIFDMPKEAIGFVGNEHLITENEIYDVCKNADDCGAIYRGGTWVERGTHISRNYIHDVRGVNGRGAMGVYFDDMLSGNYVEDNIISNCSTGVFVHGGRDNVITDNFVYNCKTPISIGTFAHINNSAFTDRQSGSLFQSLYSVRYNQNPYRSKYPQLVQLVQEKDKEPFYPKNNVIDGNIIYNSGEISKSTEAIQYSTFTNNKAYQRALYINQ